MFHGSISSPAGGPRGRTVWLGERPERLGGAWALGCAFCAHAYASADGAKRRLRASTPEDKNVRTNTKFARHEVRAPTLQSRTIYFHSNGDEHRRAQSLYFHPDEPAIVSLQASMSDDLLLLGKVPQPCDWLRVWRRCVDPRSWSSAERDVETEDYIAVGHERSRPATRKSMKAMMHIMAANHRDRKRKWLREATVIFWSFDDKGGRKLLMFKVDTPTGANDSKSSIDPTWIPYGARIAIAGCVPVGREDKMSDYEEDYGMRTAAEVIKIIERLCTPRPGACVDAALRKHVLDITGGITVDGALLKTAHLLKIHWMKNICIIVRDPCHIIRPSCKNPLEDADKFDEQNERLFGSKNAHAVLKDIQTSVQWQNQLETCQRHVIAEGSAAEDVRSLLRHLGFVEPRWESFVAPRRRYVCLLRAIAHLLVLKAGDMRLKPDQRARAQAALEAMTPADCFTAGVAGDYGEVCLEFLRIFDVADMDPARLTPEMYDFKRALRTFFVDGYLLCEPDAACVDAAGKTLTQIAVEAVMEPLVLRSSVGGRGWV